MDYTYLDYFNYYLKEFLNEIVSKFPDFKHNVVQNYRSFLEGKDSKNDMYVKYFYTKINNHLISIAKKDESIFSTPGLVFIEGVDFHNLWNSRLNNTENKAAIWKYLQLLMLIGRKVIPNHKEIVEMLKKVGGEVNVPAKVQKTLAELDEEDKKANEKSNGLDLGNIMNMATSLAGGSKGGSGMDGLDLGGLVKNLSDTLGNLDIPPPDNFSSFNDNTDNVESTDSANETQTQENDNNNNSNNDNSNSGNGKPHLNLFADLAKEMTDTFDFDEMEKEGQPQNVGEALQKFMSGNNPNKLMNMVNKFGTKLQSDISSGKVNQQDLLKETLGMMNNLQKGASNPDVLKKEAEKLIGDNPELKARLNRAHNSNDTKERLRQKLEKRNDNDN